MTFVEVINEQIRCLEFVRLLIILQGNHWSCKNKPHFPGKNK